MLNKNYVLTFLTGVFIIFSVSCTARNRITDFTIISTKNVDFSRLGDMKRGPSRTTGEDKLTVIMSIPLGSIPTIKEAIDVCIESIPGAVALVDGVIYSEDTEYYVVKKYGYIVEGTPLIDPKIAAVLPSKYIYAKFNDKDKKFKISYLSKEKFKVLRTDILSD